MADRITKLIARSAGRRVGVGQRSHPLARPVPATARPHAIALGAGLALLLASCASFRPVPASELAPGDPVRVHLTGEGLDLLRELGGGNTRRVDGVVVETREERLLVRIPWVRQMGVQSGSLDQQLWLEAAHIADLEQRHPERTRTAMLVGAASAAAAIAVAVTFGRSSGKSGCPASDPVPDPSC